MVVQFYVHFPRGSWRPGRLRAHTILLAVVLIIIIIVVIMAQGVYYFLRLTSPTMSTMVMSLQNLALNSFIVLFVRQRASHAVGLVGGISVCVSGYTNKFCMTSVRGRSCVKQFRPLAA